MCVLLAYMYCIMCVFDDHTGQMRVSGLLELELLMALNLNVDAGSSVSTKSLLTTELSLQPVKKFLAGHN